MINEKENTHLSKFLSMVLRHQPEVIGIELDAQGWVDVDELLRQANKHGTAITFEVLKFIVDTNSKKRFAFDADCKQIRASQGHSVDVDLGYAPQIPPDILYHGTASRFAGSILKTGIVKQSRRHVHLSADLETAIKVGKRHGKPVIFEIAAGQMHQRVFSFFYPITTCGLSITCRLSLSSCNPIA